MKKSGKPISTFDSIDNSDNVSASESLISTVKQSVSIPTRMENCPVFNDNSNYVSNRNGYIRFGDRPNLCSSKNGLQYPEGIDPYKICREIIFLIFICISMIALFGISFVNLLFCNNLGVYKSKEKLIEESMMCSLILLSALLLIFYGFRSRSWIQSILNRGFYTFSENLHRKRIVIIFIWFAGVFLFSPVLVALRAVCEKSSHNNQTSSNITCCIHEFCKLSKYNWLQLFLGIKITIILIGLVYYLFIMCKFKINRHWPDVWHDNLLEESPLVEQCPLIKACELRIDNGAADDGTVSISTGAVVPGDPEIMRMQAYLIKYLRHLNSELARKVFSLHAANRNQSMDSLDCTEYREPHFDTTVTVSTSNANSNGRC